MKMGFLSKLPETLSISSRREIISYKNQLDWIIAALEIGSNFSKKHSCFCWKSRKLYFSSEKKISSDTRHALKPFQPSFRPFYALKGDKNVKFAEKFLKILLWFLSSIFLLFMIHNHGSLLVVLDWLLVSKTFSRYFFFLTSHLFQAQNSKQKRRKGLK